MLFSRNGFKSVDTTEAFVKEALEFGNKDVVLSLVHETGVIDIVFSPTMDAIEAEKAAKKAELLAKLGISEDDAKLLFS